MPGPTCNWGSRSEQPGVPLQANWDVPSAIAALSLGRPLSGNSNVSVNLLAPDQMRSPRVNILDFRAGKLLRFGNTRANIAIDLYNMLNLDTVITQNFNYVPERSVARAERGAHRAHAWLTLQYDF